ncbi:hypothetical protein MGYG_06917 [Nannizzia gypsea CBS 118893]|uniref:Uncharacterized protein n=1 Tax=Arthroderma gypseum (strain ATCC MYA-4604 / CBS 118893) TaxID=535722 RepID=E4V1K3_ARTGP|nr:hypothetical protein MGYG_06917 [Nannizzia gypsea CBS 118893]EFR03918.1 hypothetical protein MGYG_06917 [Nannizzia gypsea CBS 118893]
MEQVVVCPKPFCKADYDDPPSQANYDERLAAIRGEGVPQDVDSRFGCSSVIRGIRCHYAFATSPAVREICISHPEFARARNARLIMSNVIPEDMDNSDKTTQPYCIWYPDFATEDTYRQIAQRFPSMRYQVGRACAAAGYDSLYAELDLLPDVSIAEEARESKTEGGRAIFDAVMAVPYRYAVMNDYTLSITLENPKFPAYLNGDTEVRWKLQQREPLPLAPFGYGWPYEKHWPGIEEDDRLTDGERVRLEGHTHLTPEEAQLLYTPLPQDLPTVNKTLLIQMAAYEGNVERYARLVRPFEMSDVELSCVLRGIYHHTMFARFWAAEIEQNSWRAQRVPGREIPPMRGGKYNSLRAAISARRIMINDIQEFYNGWPDDAPQPLLTWFPLKPSIYTLEELANRAPSMRQAVAIACIFCDYEELYKKIDIPPDLDLKLAAAQSSNPFYLQDIKRKVAEGDLHLQGSLYVDWMEYPMEIVEYNHLLPRLQDELHFDKHTGAPHGSDLETGSVQRYVWSPPELLKRIERCELGFLPDPSELEEPSPENGTK